MPVPKFPANRHKLNPASCLNRGRWCLTVLEDYETHSTNLPQKAHTTGGPSARPKDPTRTYPTTLAQNFQENLSYLSRKKRWVGSLIRLPHLIKFPNPTCYSLNLTATHSGKQFSPLSVDQPHPKHRVVRVIARID